MVGHVQGGDEARIHREDGIAPPIPLLKLGRIYIMYRVSLKENYTISILHPCFSQRVRTPISNHIVWFGKSIQFYFQLKCNIYVQFASNKKHSPRRFSVNNNNLATCLINGAMIHVSRLPTCCFNENRGGVPAMPHKSPRIPDSPLPPLSSLIFTIRGWSH